MKRLTESGEQLREVIVATGRDARAARLQSAHCLPRLLFLAHDVKSWGIEEGVYLVDTGSTGLSETFAVLSATYMCTMAASAMVYRFPAPGYTVGAPAAPAKQNDAAAPTKAAPVEHKPHNVAVSVANRTPQFWLAYSGFGLSICGAYGILSTGCVFGSPPRLVC